METTRVTEVWEMVGMFDGGMSELQVCSHRMRMGASQLPGGSLLDLTQQSYSHFRAFALRVPSFWNVLLRV